MGDAIEFLLFLRELFAQLLIRTVNMSGGGMGRQSKDRVGIVGIQIRAQGDGRFSWLGSSDPVGQTVSERC